MEKNEKALEAFWCMFDAAEENDYSISSQTLGVDIRKKVEGKWKVIGFITIDWTTSEKKVKTGWFTSRTENVFTYFIKGIVINLNKNKSFTFVFYTPEIVDDVINRIKGINKAANDKAAKDDEDALNELLYSNSKSIPES